MTDNPRREAALAACMTYSARRRFYETEAQFDVRAAREVVDAILAAADAAAPAKTASVEPSVDTPAPLPADVKALVGRLRERPYRRLTETGDEAAERRQRERDEAADALERLARQRAACEEQFQAKVHELIDAIARAERAEAALAEAREALDRVATHKHAVIDVQDTARAARARIDEIMGGSYDQG